ncbi:MAG TPA: methylated-DNA--[protein]-cysteine S-methyltransferase [Acidimicrobiales bacterium]
MATTVIDTPIGPLALTAGAAGLVRIDFGTVPGGPDPGGDAAAAATLGQAGVELAEYFAGTRHVFTVPLDRSARSGFRGEVLSVLESVPYGETITYGELAAEAGRPGAARAVGTAMATNPLPIIVPCHRVTRSGGVIGSYGGGVDTKETLLRLEGALPVSSPG